MENLKLWVVYFRPEGTSEWFFLTRNYWEIRVDEVIYRNTMIDHRLGNKHEYVKVIQSLDEDCLGEEHIVEFI